MTIDFAGRSVVVTGAGRGPGRLYALDLADVTAEDIADHLAAVAATEPFTVPMSVADELVVVRQTARRPLGPW